MKILIVYASAGAGHKKAAEAVYEALSEKIDKKDISLVDSLDYANRFFRWLYAKKYITLVNYLPDVWGFFYYLFDKEIVYKLLKWPRRIVNAVSCRRFEEFLCRERPDVIVTAHFMANEIVSHLKQTGRLKCRLFSAVTDYQLHSFWVVAGVDRYFVATEKTRTDLIKRGVHSNRICVTGMPVSPKFSIALDKGRTRIKLGIDSGLFTALIIGGGFGIGPVEELVRHVSAISSGIQLLVVCGYNKNLYEKVSSLVSSLGIKAKVYGFVDNVHELMSASDVLITKSGGLTASEALAKDLPMIFIKPIPGQEERNSRVFQDYKAAFVALDARAVGEKVKVLFEEPGRLEAMRASIKNIARPDSARRIADLVLSG